MATLDAQKLAWFCHHAAGAAQKKLHSSRRKEVVHMNAELDLGFKLVVFLVMNGLVLLELTKPKQKPRQKKWRGR